MKREAVDEAVFGMFDGMASLIGLLGGFAVAHAANHTVLQGCLGMAVAAGVGMGFGDRRSGATWRRATVMGVATLTGALGPAIPVVLLPGPLGYVVAALVAVAVGAAISEASVRSNATIHETRRHAYVSTFAMLVIASSLAVGAALLGGGG